MAPSGVFEPLTTGRLAERLAETVQQWTDGRAGAVLRLAVDGPACARPLELAASLADQLGRRSRPAVVVDSHFFWRDASVRLEHGHDDVDSYYWGWLDVDALNREVLDRAAGGSYLDALRDPVTNRTTRRPYRELPSTAVVVVAGELLLGAGLSFDRSVHLSVSPAARLRRTAPDWAWTLPAFERYDADVRPERLADAVVRLNDPARPALQVGAGGLSGPGTALGGR